MADKKTTKKTPATRVSKVDPNETKDQKFIRLANRRVNKVIKALDQIGLLGSASYISTESQREAVTRTLTDALQTNLDRLNKQKKSAADFKL